MVDFDKTFARLNRMSCSGLQSVVALKSEEDTE
jgi:hypothetical protein